MLNVFRSLLLALLVTVSGYAHGGQPQSLEAEPVVVQTPRGPVTFMAEIAETPEQRAIGLMYRDRLGADSAMLFDYHRPQPAFMWMKNTLIPLDMLFIAADGVVLHIEADAQPGDLRPRGTMEPVRGVLEVAAGTVDRLGIRPGMIVHHRIFGNELPPGSGG